MAFLESILANVVAGILIFFLGALATVIVLRFTAKSLDDVDLEQYLLSEIAKRCGRDRQFVWEFVLKSDFKYFNRQTIVYVGHSKSDAMPRYDQRHVLFFDVAPPQRWTGLSPAHRDTKFHGHLLSAFRTGRMTSTF